MCQLYNILKTQSTYFDRKHYLTPQQYQTALASSSTVYVGNLSFFTAMDSIHELFSMAGNLAEIIMGVNDEGNPTGFCFVVYQTRQEASNAVQFISRTKLNDRIIRVDWDAGYKEGREKGRGTGGQQRREDFRTKEDAERPRIVPIFENRDKGKGETSEGQQRERTREKRDYNRDKEGKRDREREKRDEKIEKEQKREAEVSKAEQRTQMMQEINEY